MLNKPIRELVIDLTSVEDKENPRDEITDNMGRVELERMLYDYVGKKIRVRISVVKTPKR